MAKKPTVTIPQGFEPIGFYQNAGAVYLDYCTEREMLYINLFPVLTDGKGTLMPVIQHVNLSMGSGVDETLEINVQHVPDNFPGEYWLVPRRTGKNMQWK